MTTIELNDPFTGEWTSFLEINETYNGNPITDSICDGIMYKKLDNKYYRRVLPDGQVNVQWFGAKGDGINDDTQYIQNTFDFIADIDGGYNICSEGKIQNFSRRLYHKKIFQYYHFSKGR